MSKKNLKLDEEVQTPAPEVTEDTVELTPAGFPNKSFSVAKVGAEFHLVEIGFNLETGDTSAIKTLGTYPTRVEARERFKILVVESGAF